MSSTEVHLDQGFSRGYRTTNVTIEQHCDSPSDANHDKAGYMFWKHDHHILKGIGEAIAFGLVCSIWISLWLFTMNDPVLLRFIVMLFGNFLSFYVVLIIGRPYDVFRLFPLIVFIDNRIPWVWKPWYIICQFLGGILFSGVPRHYFGSAGCMGLPSPTGSYWDTFWISLIAILMIVCVFLLLGYKSSKKAQIRVLLQSQFCLAYSGVIALCIAGTLTTGASLDLARYVASIFWAWNCWTSGKGLPIIVPAIIAFFHVIFSFLRYHLRKQIRKGQ